MIFFIIVPLWVLSVLAGLVLTMFRTWRWVGIYLIAASTGGALLSCVGSLGGLLGAHALAEALQWKDLELPLLAMGYFGGLVLGGMGGALLGLSLVGWRHYRWRQDARRTVR